MTTPASIIVDTRMDACLEIVYTLRRLKASPPYDTSTRQGEFGLMRDAFKTTSVDSLWRALREINAKMLEKSKHHPLTRESTSTEDEDANLMNMLSWYMFHLKASTSTSAIGASSSLNIHKMLRELESKSMILYTPTWDESNLRPVDVLRRQFLIMSQTNMLEYVKYDVTTSSGNGMYLPNGDGVLKENFRIVDKDAETMVFPKDEDEGTARISVERVAERFMAREMKSRSAILWKIYELYYGMGFYVKKQIG